MRGEDDEETSLLRRARADAQEYLMAFNWCRSIREAYWGAGIGGVVAIFLFRIDPEAGADEWLWVVVGDLPSAYIVTDRADNPIVALEIYCDLMQEWIDAVRGGTDISDAFPVEVAATERNVVALERRVAFLRTKVIPTLGEEKVRP